MGQYILSVECGFLSSPIKDFSYLLVTEAIRKIRKPSWKKKIFRSEKTWCAAAKRTQLQTPDCLNSYKVSKIFFQSGRFFFPKLVYKTTLSQIDPFQAQEAIDNCVGSPEKIKLETTGDLSFFNTQEPKPKVRSFVLIETIINNDPSLRHAAASLYYA